MKQKGSVVSYREVKQLVKGRAEWQLRQQNEALKLKKMYTVKSLLFLKFKAVMVDGGVISSEIFIAT